MKKGRTRYNSSTERFADAVEKVLEGEEAEILFVEEKDAEEARIRLSKIFQTMQKEYHDVGLQFTRPVPHKIKKSWEEGGLKGDWTVKLDFVKRRKKVYRFVQVN